ncbi:hypothetical protein B0T21DRAFT_449013 [Apiosordaria backusii]|uniref:Uncharacterized protein n=1 Tax=Apiosordaria backusii TaxID=314023 RepID=A0AA40K198_9PEZI|nr:hypothetical protein B0T21DRAFT_449013 [Apiosordaria backusii]
MIVKMGHRYPPASVLLALLLSQTVTLVLSQSVVYVTDLTIFNSLAPCASWAVSYNIHYLTRNACPQAVTELQSCVCSKNNNLASIGSEISSSVRMTCGSTASDDQSSAATVLSAYCNQATPVSFPSPTGVSVAITDIAEMDLLAPCAKTALGYAVREQRGKCPTDIPGYASCACFKNQNSLLVSQEINTSVRGYCSSNTADVSSAQAIFAAYCGLNNGTSNFPKPTDPPGAMTYYITDLPQYQTLAPCASSALSYAVQGQTRSLCPAGPKALASCACMKEGMTLEILREITSSVKGYCASTATEDISSAVAVYNYYCSAAENKVSAAGVTNSVDQTYATGVSGGGPRATGGPGSSGGGSSGGGGSDTDNSSSSRTNLGMIIGIAAGALAGIVLLGALIWRLCKSSRDRRERERLALANQQPPPGEPKLAPPAYRPYASPIAAANKPAFASDVVAAPPPVDSPAPSSLQVTSPGRTDNVSPISTTGPYSPPPNHPGAHGQSSLYPPMPGSSELHSQHAKPPSPYNSPPPPNAPELHGQAAASSLYPPMPNTSELHSQHSHPGGQQRPLNAPELYGQGAPSVNRPELQGQGAMIPPPPHAPELYGQGAPLANRPELQGQGGMYPSQPHSHNMSELQGQGSHFHNVNMNRPELQGQGAMYAPPPPPGTQELQGQGTPFHNVTGGRTELPGQYGYQPPAAPGQGQPQQGGGYQAYQPGYGQQQPPPAAPGQPSWQSGPVPGTYEMGGDEYHRGR